MPREKTPQPLVNVPLPAAQRAFGGLPIETALDIDRLTRLATFPTVAPQGRAPVQPRSLPEPRTAEAWVQHFMTANPGNARLAFEQAMARRHQNPRDLDLRDAEHNLFVRSLMEEHGPLVGGTAALMAVPGYSATKALAQLGVPPLTQAIEWLTGMELSKSTPPDFNEILFALRPLMPGRQAPAMPLAGPLGPPRAHDRMEP